MELNKYQSTPDSLNLEEYPAEIKEDFYNFVTNVPYIKNLISADRPKAADCPRDDLGRIIVDLTNPPIIEDTDYFRPTALYFLEHGVLTHLRPNPNPNSEYGKWVREEIRRCYMGYVRPSDGAWVTGDMYFFLNYCPIMKVKKIKGRKGIRVVDFPDFLEGQWLKFMYIDKAREAGKHGSELAARGRGKAHPYDEFIYTPDGVKQWKDIKVGDYIFGDNGKLTKVIDIPFDDIAPIYELTLSSGYKVKCSEGHLWKVYSHCRGEIIVSTKELLNLYKRPRKISPHNPSGIELDCTIPVGKGVEFPYNKTDIDPYTFGLLLGDGCFRHLNNKNTVYFTSNNEDFEIYKNIIPYNYIKYNSKYSYGIRINNIGNILKSYNLNYKKSEDKFIPDEYKYNSRAVRIALLKGLLDTDGTVTRGKIELVLSSRKMVEDVQWLCSSLGIATSNIRIKKTWYYNSDRVKVHCLDAYRLSIFSEINLFTLPRKTKLWSNRSKTNYGKSKYKGYKIVNIKYIGKLKAKCITVDNESHCYLINNFIVTHNSYTMAAIMAKRFILGEYNELEHKATTKVETFCASYLKNYLNEDGVLNKFESYIDFCSEYTLFPKKRLISSMNNMHWLMGYKDNNSEAKKGSLNEVIGISVKDSEGKLRGKRGAFIGLEEFGSFPNLIGLYGTLRPSMEDGDVVFGMIYAQGCVCAGTKVLKLNGEPVNIEDVNINDHLLGYNGNNYSNEKISWLSPKAYKECLHIKTSKNNELKCSVDHPILALNKDKFGHSKKTCSFYLANELLIGDTLLIPKVEGHFGNIHEENAFLLGALFGDGSYSDQSCVTLSISSEEEYEYYNNLYNINISKLSLKPLYAQIYFKGIHLLLKKYKMDKQSFNKKQLPYNIFNWDKESLCAFLGGYFNADGNIQIVKNKHRVIKLTCKYCYTLQIVKSLLNKIGINSHIYKEHKKKRILHSNVNNRDYIMLESDIYVLYISTSKDICTFRNNIKFLIKKKLERLDSYIQLLDKNISNNLKFVLRPNGKGKNFIGKEFNNLQEVRIKSIDNIGIQRIYNMTADTTHTYITNGFISSNTAGDKESDFKAAQLIMYSPRAFNMYPIDNVYDKVGLGKPEFVYFYPAYLNRNGCYSKDGISDVTKAILEVLINRYNVKYNTSNTSLITKTIAEHPITPQEAIMKTQGNLFPVLQLNERINQIDSNPNEFDDVYVGTLTQLKNGKVEFKPTLDPPIREFPTEDNKEKGAIEIFSLPEIDREGNVYRDRYIMGHDPVDDDQSNTMSLTSTFVFDLFTDKIVAEYTGRQPYADDNFEIVRKLCLFYNAKCLYEAHPYSQKVNTPNGIKLWEDIKVGDTLFSPTKGEVTVIDIPVNKEMPIYKITLEDGRTIDASDNHKWVVYKENSEVTTEITTELMMKEGLTKLGKYKFFIPEHTGVHYKSKILPIDPYVMGLILTKGLILEKDLYENKIQINLSLDDIKDIKLRIPYDITIRDHKCYFNIKDLNVSLREYFNNNLFSSPFINPLYLYSDTEQRLALLRGLMDGNGNPDIKGPTLFLTEYKELYENILSLARSLGIKCSGKVTKSGKYKILLYPVCRIFKLRNKAQTLYKYSTHSKNKNALIVLKTAIKSIEYSHKEWGKCVTVDSKDGLYLIGDYVVTHNCNKKGIFAYFSKMNCLYLLAETPQYLKDLLIIKEIGYGNKSRGVNATHSINNYADQLTREWLIKPVVIPSKDEEEEVSIPNLMFIKNRAFLQELASYNPNGNYDRIRAFGMVMLYRQEKIILYLGDMNRVVEDNNINNPANDDFFTINYDNRF